MKKEILSTSMPKLIIVILVTGVGMVFGLIGYFGIMDKNEVVINNKAETEIITQDEISNWKTYRNTIHNYEIKYPDDSVSARELNFDISPVTERSNEVVFIIRNGKESEIDKTSCLTIESESLIEEQFNLSLSELISNITNDFKKKELININGEEIVKLSFEGGSGLEFTDRRSFLDNENKDIFFIKHNNIIFIMTLYIIQEDKSKVNSNQIFNQMLSTFKFIKKDETADWKTYQNEKYGFKINLLEPWKGYEIFEEFWKGVTLDYGSTKYEGPKIVIRNPKWSESEIWQDIPILVFTKFEWQLIEDKNLNIFAAPIAPSKLGENNKYVFSLPPRWVGFTDALGQDEAQEIVGTFEAVVLSHY